MKETTTEKTVQEKMEELGFGVQDTGGGCQWLRKDLSKFFQTQTTERNQSK